MSPRSVQARSWSSERRVIRAPDFELTRAPIRR